MDRGSHFGSRRGGPGSGFSSVPRASTITEGQTAIMQSNLFQFGVTNVAGSIYLYKVEFGTADTDIECRLAAIRSIKTDLTKILGIFTNYGSYVFSAVQIL